MPQSHFEYSLCRIYRFIDTEFDSKTSQIFMYIDSRSPEIEISAK